MRILLNSIVLRNFKGIRFFEMKLDAMGASVLGDNATGKTTIMDAMFWLLFDKNSENKADFGIKTIVDGKPIHRLEHEVEAVLAIDSDGDVSELKLRKAFREIYKKTRGKLNEEFAGHTTDYFINDVFVRASVYKERIKGLINEDLFKLLTSPHYFNQSLDWQKRRKLVLEVAGDMTDMEVINSTPELSKLSALLKGMSIDEMKKTMQAQAKKINDRVQEIPIRISELTNSLPALGSLDTKDLEYRAAQLREDIQDLNDKLSEVRLSGKNTAYENEAAELSRQMSDVKQRMDQARTKHRFDCEQKSREHSSKVDEVTRCMKGLEVQKQALVKLIAECVARKERLGAEFDELSVKVYEGQEPDTVCKYCGAPLATDKVNEIKLKIREEQAAFNVKKAERLSDINARGKANNADIDSSEKLQVELEEKISALQLQLDALQASKPEFAEFEIKQSDSEQLDKLKAAYERVLKLVHAPEDAAKTAIAEIEGKIAGLRAQEKDINNEVAQYNTAAKSKERIEILKNEEKSLAQEYATLMENIYLCESFVRTKVAALESRINAKFELARFKLFEPNISNDGISECCVTTYKDVAYCDLNNAARINVGLDIIKSLTAHYGVSAPIFIDNAEAVTQLNVIPEAQIVRLVVSADHKELTIDKN